MKLFNFINILIVSIFFSSCSVTFQNALPNHNYSKDNLNLRLQNENYTVIGTAHGTAKATYIFNFGGLSTKARTLFTSSYNDMVENAHLRKNQAIINVISEKRVNLSAGPIFSRQIVHTTGTIIEFNHLKQTADIITRKDEQLEQLNIDFDSIKIGTIINYKDTPAVVFSISEKDRRIKVLRTSDDVYHWNHATSLCNNMSGNWRLPTLEEMEAICSNKDIINSSLETIGKVRTISGNYWTSKEVGKNKAEILRIRKDKSETAVILKAYGAYFLSIQEMSIK